MSEFTVVNPATEEIVTTVPRTTADETDAAIERAVMAQVAWRAVAPADRAGLLRSFASAVDAHVEELAGLEVASAGPSRSARPAGRPARSGTCSPTTPPRRSGPAAGRSRWPAAWTSPSPSRSASSA